MSHRSKDSLGYWKACLRRVKNSPYWYIELQRKKLRRKISLETSNKDAAAYLARDIWRYVRLHGWDGYMARFKPQSLPNPDPSLGEYLTAVERTADLNPRTLKGYTSALQKIAGDISGLGADPIKFASGSKARKAWLEKLHDVKLSVLSAAAVQEWKRSFLARAGQDPLSQRSARVSANSFLRCARSLFSPRIVKHLRLQLPSPLPFADCQFEPKGNTKYRSEFSITELIAAARDELAGTEPEVFKIFALATFAGLRRKEIDLLPWSAFRFTEGLLRIEQTIHFSSKSQDSLDDVPLDPEVLELFRGYRAQATGEFVIESPQPPRPELLYNYYRCNEAFERLTSWLRSKGLTSKKPLHTLRKEFGSQLCATHGIYAASRALRHSSIAISAAFYTDSRARATVGLGHLLSPKVVEFPRQEVA
jgi:integrase